MIVVRQVAPNPAGEKKKGRGKCLWQENRILDRSKQVPAGKKIGAPGAGGAWSEKKPGVTGPGPKKPRCDRTWSEHSKFDAGEKKKWGKHPGRKKSDLGKSKVETWFPM